MFPMKIALITNLCSHYRYKLFKILIENHQFSVYFFENLEKSKEDIEHLTVYKNFAGFSYMPVRKILQKLLKNKYDVIIKCTNNKWAFFGCFLISKIIKAKFIVWHSIWYYPETMQYKLFSWLFLKILKDCTDAIVVYGEHGKRFLVEKGINPEKIFIAWQTVDNEMYGRNISEKELEDIYAKYNLKKNVPIILYVGRIVELKGIEYLLEASKILKNRGLEFTLFFVGDGKMRAFVENFCQKEGIDYRISGIVSHDALPPFYKIATLLVLPSITTKTFKEPWGLVVNEAFNQGCPAIVTDAVGAGIGGLVRNEENGLIVPERNAFALAEAIERILKDNKLRERMSEKAKEEIKEWTYERQAQGFLDAVTHCLK